MSLPNVLALTSVIQFPDSFHRPQVCGFGEKFRQSFFRTINQPFRHHFHEVYHDVVSPAIADIKFDFRAFLDTRILEIKESLLL